MKERCRTFFVQENNLTPRPWPHVLATTIFVKQLFPVVKKKTETFLPNVPAKLQCGQQGLTVFCCAVSFALNIRHSFPFFEANTQLELTMANNSAFLIINTELPCLKLGFPLFKYMIVHHGVTCKR